MTHYYSDSSIIYYIADLPVTPLRVLTNKSDNIAVPYASLRLLILLLSSLSFAFLTHGMVDSVSHKKDKINVKLYSNGKMNFHIYFYVSILFSLSPPIADWYYLNKKTFQKKHL